VVRPAGGGWQTPVNLSESGEDSCNPQIAVDPHGDAVAVWERFPNNNHDMDVVQASVMCPDPHLNELSIRSSGVAGQQLSFSVAPSAVWSLEETHWSFHDGAGASGTSVTQNYTAAGSYHMTVTSTDMLGNATSASGTVTITPSPTPTAVPTSVTRSITRTSARPSVASLTQSHRTWREHNRRGGFARKPTAPAGTTFSFALNEQASVRFTATNAAGQSSQPESLSFTIVK
jgi:hypothetical protein